MYLYIYSNDISSKLPIANSLQSSIKKNIPDGFDSIEIRRVSPDIIAKYRIVCIDHFSIFQPIINISELYPYLDIISKCKNICLLTRDLHEWTFSKDHKTQWTPIMKLNKYKRIYQIPDAHGAGMHYLKKLLEQNNIKYLISIYDCKEFDKIISYTKTIPYVLSLHVDTDIYNDTIKVEKDIDILIYGDDLYPIYPLRNNIKRVVSKMHDVKHHIINIRNPIRDQELANLIKRAWLTVCTCSVCDYLVLKYFETSACGSVVIGNMATQGKPIWEDNYINIPDNANDEKIQTIILTALNNKQQLIEIGERMSQKIMNEYNYTEYGKKLKNICDSILIGNEKI